MITVTDSIEIIKTPEKLYSGLIKFFSSQEDYKKWHKDHVECRWIKGQPFEIGSILYCEEYLHGELHTMKLRCTTNVPDKEIQYKILFPMSLICPKGSFIIEPKEGSSIFTATLSIRFGWLFQALAKSRVEAITKHMKEEGENLKEILENEI